MDTTRINVTDKTATRTVVTYSVRDSQHSSDSDDSDGRCGGQGRTSVKDRVEDQVESKLGPSCESIVLDEKAPTNQS